MKFLIKTTLLIALVAGISSCTGPSPQKVVAQTWLNTNNITSHFSPKFFGTLLEMKSKGRITVFKNGETTNGTAVEYVRQNIIPQVNESLKKVESLPEKKETKELKAASLDVFNYGKEIFENDYVAIAKMIDEKQPADIIVAATVDLFSKHEAEMYKRLDKLDSFAIPYAEKHNIPVKTMNNQLR